jgi:hypothetical protein
MDDHTSKDHPQLVTVKRINSIYKQNPSNDSITSLQDDQIVPSNMDKRGSQSSLQTSITNIFRVNYFLICFFYSLIIFFSSHLINEINDKVLIVKRI